MNRSYLGNLRRTDRKSLGLIILQFATNASTFMSFPLLSILLKQQGHDGVFIGAVLTTVLVCAKGLPLLIGHIIDRLGGRIFITGGLMMRAAGFSVFFISDSPSASLLAALLIGIGAAAYETAVYALLARQGENERRFLFLLNNQALNSGVILGPAIGTVLSWGRIDLAFAASAVFFTLSALAAPFFCHRTTETRPDASGGAIRPLAEAFRDRRFALLCAILVPWWLIFAQLYTSFPLFLLSLLGHGRDTQVIFIVNGVTGMLMAFVLAPLFSRFGEVALIRLGYLLLAILFMAAPTIGAALVFFALIALYTVAETIILASSDAEIAHVAPKGREATYFGASHISWIIGGGLGNFLGAELSSRGAFTSLWWLLAAMAVIGATGMTIYRSRFRGAQQEKTRTKEEATALR